MNYYKSAMSYTKHHLSSYYEPTQDTEYTRVIRRERITKLTIKRSKMFVFNTSMYFMNSSAPCTFSMNLDEATRVREWGRCTPAPRLHLPRLAVASLCVGFSSLVIKREGQPKTITSAIPIPRLMQRREARHLVRVWMGHKKKNWKILLKNMCYMLRIFYLFYSEALQLIPPKFTIVDTKT